MTLPPSRPDRRHGEAHTPPAVTPAPSIRVQPLRSRMELRYMPSMLAVVVVVALAGAGCSGSDPVSTSSTPSGSASTADPEADPGAPLPMTTASLPPATGQACGD